MQTYTATETDAGSSLTIEVVVNDHDPEIGKPSLARCSITVDGEVVFFTIGLRFSIRDASGDGWSTLADLLNQRRRTDGPFRVLEPPALDLTGNPLAQGLAGPTTMGGLADACLVYESIAKGFLDLLGGFDALILAPGQHPPAPILVAWAIALSSGLRVLELPPEGEPADWHPRIERGMVQVDHPVVIIHAETWDWAVAHLATRVTRG